MLVSSPEKVYDMRMKDQEHSPRESFVKEMGKRAQNYYSTEGWQWPQNSRVPDGK